MLSFLEVEFSLDHLVNVVFMLEMHSYMKWDKKDTKANQGKGKETFFPPEMTKIIQDLLTRLELIFYQKAQRDDKTQRFDWDKEKGIFHMGIKCISNQGT